MFAKLSLIAAAVAPLASALSLTTPTGLTSNGQFTLQFSGSGTDPLFSVELINTIFNNAFAIANNIQPTAGSINITLGTVPPGDGYSIQAVNVSNIAQVFATTGDISIGASTVTGSAASTASGSAASTGSGASASTTGASASASGVSASGSGASASATSPSSASASGSNTASASTASTSNFNNSGAVKLGSSVSVGSVAIAALAAVAGVAAVAF